MKKVIDWLAKSNIFLYSISLTVITFAMKLMVHIIKYILKIPDIQFREELVDENYQVTVNLILNTLIFAPILETLLFQTFFFTVFKRLKVKKRIITLFSGIAFGAFHYYSAFYMVQASLIGFLFMHMYILRAEINNKPFISTAIAHFAINLTITIAVLITHFYKFGTWF